MNPQSTLSVFAVAAALALGPGCKSSSGHQASDTTAGHMDALRASADSLKAKVNAAAGSLSVVVEKAEVDPKTPFEQYKKDVAAVNDWVAKAESNLKAVRAQGQTYFAEWEKQATTMQDPELKETAEERRAELKKAVDAIGKAMEEVRVDLTPFVASIKDVQTYLSNDLTPAGIETVEGKSKKLIDDAETIGEKLDDLVETLEENAPAFKTAKPPPPAPK